MLGVALRRAHQIGRHIERGIVQYLMAVPLPAYVLQHPFARQLVGALPIDVILVESRIVAVGEAGETVFLVPAHLTGAPLTKMIVNRHAVCGSDEKIIWFAFGVHYAAKIANNCAL